METRVLIRSSPKPTTVNPPPQWCSWWNLIMIGQLVSEILMFESVDARTDELTPARVPYYKLTLSLRLWLAKNVVIFGPSLTKLSGSPHDNKKAQTLIVVLGSSLPLSTKKMLSKLVPFDKTSWIPAKRPTKAQTSLRICAVWSEPLLLAWIFYDCKATEERLEFLSLKGGCTGSPESTLVKMPHCWKPHVAPHISKAVLKCKV